MHKVDSKRIKKHIVTILLFIKYNKFKEMDMKNNLIRIKQINLIYKTSKVKVISKQHKKFIKMRLNK